MELVIKSVKDWIEFLTEIDRLKDKYGSNIISKTINNINALNEGMLPDMKEQMELFNLLYENKFYDLNVLKNFLESIKFTCRFGNRIINVLKELEERFGIDKIAFINQSTGGKKQIELFSNVTGFRKVYLPDRVMPYVVKDYKTNGIDIFRFRDDMEFVVDTKDFKNSSLSSRMLYTPNFILNVNTLPSKEEMDEYSICEERKAIFSSLLESLWEYKKENVHLIVVNPNQIYLKNEDINIDKYSTIRTDGMMFDENNVLLAPSKIDLSGTSKVLVKNAYMVVIANISDNEIQDIYIIVEHQFLLDYVQEVYNNNGELKRPLEMLLGQSVEARDINKLMLRL